MIALLRLYYGYSGNIMVPFLINLFKTVPFRIAYCLRKSTATGGNVLFHKMMILLLN